MSKENKKDTTGWKNEDFLQMCDWVERELMGYSGTQRLHKNACLRLQGLRKGQSMANNSHEMYGEYPIMLFSLEIPRQKPWDQYLFTQQ